jgi:hypothetical protein
MTTTAPGNVCPHCGTDNSPGATICASCGKALLGQATAPQILSASALPTTEAGAVMVSAELKKQMRTASWILLIVGLIQIAVGSVLLAAVWKRLATATPDSAARFYALEGLQFGFAILFVGMFFWARFQPLAATVSGLCLYCLLVLVNMINAASAAASAGSSGNAPHSFGIGCLDILIIALLAKGVSAANTYRKLRRTSSTGGFPVIP